MVIQREIVDYPSSTPPSVLKVTRDVGIAFDSDEFWEVMRELKITAESFANPSKIKKESPNLFTDQELRDNLANGKT